MNKAWQILPLSTIGIIVPYAASGQIIPDGTVGTQIAPLVNINRILSDRIDGGTIRGSNLFHSFQEFNISAQTGVYFSNPTGITNIFTRVTGTNPSNINGTLGVLGNANLFFINPNGVIFGSGARLSLQGSFLATTANSINFADGTQFATNNPQAAPLLTVSVPVGLGFGSSTKAIEVQGVRHNLTVQRPLFSPYVSGNTASGLQVQPGKTLALVGGDVHLSGGILTAASGRIEIGSVGAAGEVGLNPTTQGLTLDYKNAPTKGNIQLEQRSLVNVSGSSAGEVQVQGNRISLSDGSTVWSQNRGVQPGGDINISAAQLLELSGTTTDERIQSGIVSETLGLGASSNINVSTARIIMQNGTTILSRTFSPAPSGNVTVKASDFIKMQGLSPQTRMYNRLGSWTFFSSQPGAKPVLTAKAGNVTVSTQHLSMQDGSYISALSFGDSSGGNISINTDTTELIGGAVGIKGLGFSELATAISSVGYALGNSGNITLNTHALTLQDGGMVTTTSLGTSNAGNITINARELVEVTGRMPIIGYISNISSTVGSPASAIQQLSSYKAEGNAGIVTINTPELKISRQGSVSVQNYGVGNAGILTINADKVQLSDRARIGASVFSGKEGNIVLRSQNLQMRRNSQIATNVGFTVKNGSVVVNDSDANTGGNININTDTIVQLENSDITANAAGRGKGGNINITTQGLFRSPDSDITAKSEVGIDGVVNITTPVMKQENSLQQQPSNFISADTVIASSCLANRNRSQGRFVITSNGSLPETPDNEELFYDVVQVRSVNNNTAISKQANVASSARVWKLGEPIQEAVQMVTTADGRLLLIKNDNDKTVSLQNLTCDG